LLNKCFAEKDCGILVCAPQLFGRCDMDLPAPPTNYPKTLTSLILCRRRPDAGAARRQEAINNCASRRLPRPIVSPPRGPSVRHHSLLQPAPPGPASDRVVERSSAVVAQPPLPPPLLLPEMPSPTIRRLDVASPVPADIDIANSVEPLPIADIAAELGLGPEHYDLYGRYKAKVRS
jgi:formate--tetrahydrofolate ligase